MAFNYHDPVSQLISIPEFTGGYKHQSWPDYVGQYGLSDQDVPELIRMACDLETFWGEADEEVASGFAPLHAIRALGQLRNPTAIEPLLHLMVVNAVYWESDYLSEEIPQAIGLMGAAAIEPVHNFLADESNLLWPRVFMTAALELIANDNPELRTVCLNILTEQLLRFEEQDEELNATYVSSIVEMNGRESADVIEQAFASGRVDLMVRGDWEDVQIELGLLDKRITPRRNYFAEMQQQRLVELADKRELEKQRRLNAKEKRRARQQNARKKKKKRKHK